MDDLQALKAINDIVGDKLTTVEQSALAKMLVANLDEIDGEPILFYGYIGAVDFLWMAFRISDGEKNKLLDLDNEEGWCGE